MYMLNKTINRKPIVWPPKIMLPPEVASPIGKVVCEPKSKTVVKKGKILTPTNAAETQISQKESV